MSKTTLPELRKMNEKDLVKEARALRDQIARERLHVRLQSQKDTAKYKRLKVQLARMETVLTEKRREELSNAAVASTVPAQSNSENSTS